MKRLFLVLGITALTSLSFALPTEAGHYWKINVPGDFAYVWINVGDLTFDFATADTTSTSWGHLLNYADSDTGAEKVVFYKAEQGGFYECLTEGVIDPTSGPNSSATYQGVTTPTGAKQYCFFVPKISTSATGNSSYSDAFLGFSATYEDPTNNPDEADASLLVFSSDLNWQMDVSYSYSGTFPNGLDLLIYPYAYDTDSNKPVDRSHSGIDIDPSSPAATILNSSTSSATSFANGPSHTSATAYYAKVTIGSNTYILRNVHLQPLEFALRLDLANIPDFDSLSSSATPLTITYTFSSP